MTRIALLVLALICSEAAADVDGGIAAYQRGDYAIAVAEFSVAAGKDDAFAQNVLGTMYAQGIGVERNYKLAMDWFFKAQALGFPEAMANLAKMYAAGLGVPQDNAAALQYYRDAALVGFQPAILRLAEIYERGELGVAPDNTLAFDWRGRLHAAQGEVSIMPAAPAAAASNNESSAGKTATAPLAKPSSRDPAVPPRVNAAASFESQVITRLGNNRQSERKLFVASTDHTPALAAYLKELRSRLKSRLAQAFSVAQPDERMIVTLTILRNGTIKDIESSQGSGNLKTDRRVLSSLRKLTRLKPLPAETEGQADVLVVTVRLPIA